MAEEEQDALSTEIEFVYYKANTFTEAYVDAAILPAVETRLEEIRQLQDKFVIKWLIHKAKNKSHPAIAALEQNVTAMVDHVADNEKKIRRKVSTLLLSLNSSPESKSLTGPEPHVSASSSKSFSYSAKDNCDAKKAEFFDLVSLLSVSCGLDIANPETEIESDDLKEIWEKKDNSEVSELMRESKNWNKSLSDLSKVFREYEKAARASSEETEEFDNNKTVFETAMSRLASLRKIILAEDKRRFLFTLDHAKSEKVKFPTFSGDKKEDFLKFKIKMTQAFEKNRVILCDQLDKLRENLRGEALKHVPETVQDLQIAWDHLKEAYGDPLRMLKERIKALDSIKALPPVKKKEARVTWFLDFESILEDVIQLGGERPGSKSYCTAFSEYTLEKILSALPDEGEDVGLRKELSAVDGEGKDQFEALKKQISKFRQDSQAFIGSSTNSKKSETAPVKTHTSCQVFSSASRLDDCRVCIFMDTNAGFTSTVELFDSHIGNFPTHCPVFISFSIAKRKALAIKAGLCSQCLDPKVTFSRDHLSQCAVGKKDQFYTCKSTGCRSHLWLCTNHKDSAQNKTAFEQESKRLKSKHGLDLCCHVIVMRTQVHNDDSRSVASVESAVNFLEQKAADSGKELVPIPDGNPLFLFFGAKGETRSLNTFMDQGSSGVLMKDGVPGIELPGCLVRKGPIILSGVGGMTALATGEWMTAMERIDGRLQTMQVITMERVTADFPRISINGAVKEIKKDKPLDKRLQKLQLPREVGGGQTDVLLGIDNLLVFPKEIHSLPCGLTIYESRLTSHNGKTNAMVGGPHSTFSALVSEAGGNHILLSHFVQGLAEWRSFGPLPLTQQMMSYKEELYACASNLLEEEDEYFEEIMSDDLPRVCSVCGGNEDVKFVNTVLTDSGNKLSLLKKIIDIQGAIDVEYRCVQCRSCGNCKDADKVEKISLREEAEMFAIKQSIFLNYEEKRIDCSLPLRGPEREFMSTNRTQAVAILNKQCQKYYDDPEVKTSINKAFKKLMDRGFIRKLEDLTDEEKAEFIHKEVQYTIPWRVVWKDSATTPVRPVLDASTNSPKRPDGSGGSSLNNAVCHGKVDTLDLLKVVLKFVLLECAVAADLTKMYNMFNLLAKYWNLQRIVMKENLDPDGEVIEGVITTLIYGVASVSCQTEEALVEIAAKCEKDEPEVASCLNKGRYVDNLLDSFRSKMEAQKVTADIDRILALLSLVCRGWSYSGEKPLEEESMDGMSLDMMGIRWFPLFDTIQCKIPRLHFGAKRRGRLDPATEFFEGDFAKMDQFVPSKLTRRQVVSKRASVYDLLGKMSPIMAKLKLFESEVISNTESWEQPISEALRSKAIQNFILLEKLRGIHFTRAKIPVDAVSDQARLILVVDAAEEVLIFTVYIGFKKKDGSWSCSHLIGRTSVCRLTIPRNEMQSMLAGSNLAWVVRKALSGYVGEQITCGDSEIVLHWILSDHRRLDQWHRNRVVQVRRSVDLDQLFKVASKDNPADIGTRPHNITEADVGPDSRYENGDYWMTLDTADAVNQGFLIPAADIKLTPDKAEDYKEGLVLEPATPEVIVQGHAVVRRDLISERANFAKYDPDLLPTKRKWPSMLRIATLVITFCARLLKRIRKPFRGKLLSLSKIKLQVSLAAGTNLLQNSRENLNDFEYSSMVVYASDQSTGGGVEVLSALASDQAVGEVFRKMFVVQNQKQGYEEVYVQLALQYYFKLGTVEVKEFNSKAMLEKIAVEEDGILFSKSRIHDVLNFIETGDLEVKDLGALNIRAKVPVIDRFSPLSYSIASHIHQSMHRGAETCYRCSLEQVHILQGFSLFKELDADCLKCKKKRGKFSEVVMGSVPDSQITVAPPFYCCQIDLWGPIKVFCPGFERDTRNSKAKETKNWILVGACPTTRALNLQVVDKSDSRGIIEALVRLGCEATWPKLFYCDADSAIIKILKEMEVDIRDVQYRLFTEHGAMFEVCPVGGHNRHGLVERRIATVQSSFKEMGLDTMRVHSMGLQTMCKVVENTLNGLPYGYTQARSDTNQSLYKLISPNLLRHGRNNNRCMAGPVRLSSDNNKMMAEVQKRTEAWFKIFRDACVPRLLLQQKWFRNERDLSVGDLVFFRKTDSELGDGDWIVGMVEQVIPSKDGLIRQAVIKYRNATEAFDRFSTRTTRKLVRLCNVDDPSLSEDLSWVQQKLEELEGSSLQVVNVQTNLDQDVETDERSKCKGCCCHEHCKVRYHSFHRKPMLNISMVNMKFGFEDIMIGELGELGPDFDATAKNMFEEDSKSLHHVLQSNSFLL